jgi:hypothetical protein
MKNIADKTERTFKKKIPRQRFVAAHRCRGRSRLYRTFISQMLAKGWKEIESEDWLPAHPLEEAFSQGIPSTKGSVPYFRRRNSNSVFLPGRTDQSEAKHPQRETKEDFANQKRRAMVQQNGQHRGASQQHRLIC